MIDFRHLSLKMGLLSVGYFSIILAGSSIAASRIGSNSLFDFVANLQSGGTTGNFVLAIGALPLLAFILPSLIDMSEQDHMVLRLQDKTRLYTHHFTFSVIASGVLTLLMALAGILASTLVVGHVDNLWTTKQGTVYFLLKNKDLLQLYIPNLLSWKLWAYILASRFLALLFMASSIIALKLLLQKNTLVFFSALILFATDALLPQGFSLFLGRTNIKLDTLLSPSELWFNLVYFLLGIVLLSILCRYLYRKKEFYN